MLNSGTGLLIVGGSYIDEIAMKRLSQGIGTGKHSNERDPGFLHKGNDLDSCRSPHVAKKRENLVLNNEFLGIGHTPGWVISVIIGDDPDLSSVHSALFVYAIKIGHGSPQGLGA